MTLQSVSRAPLMDEVGAAASSAALPAEVLTRREREVLELVTQGYLDREIAERLTVSMSSIKTHIRLIYRKIDVSTRAQAVQWGVHHGAGC